MTITIQRATSLCVSFILIVNLISEISAFRSSSRTKQNGISTSLTMGLYDTPLPPRPERRNNEDENNNDDNEDDDDDSSSLVVEEVQQRLFQFNVDGTEKRDLLPRLSRSLDSGIGCYFEETDRLVQNLVKKTDCNPKDAAWALEACKGDITEAWTRISMARRQLLQDGTNNNIGGGGMLFSEVSDLMAENEFEIRKEEMMEKDRERKRKEYLEPSKPDDDWLPLKNPKPIDDEPWFTG